MTLDGGLAVEFLWTEGDSSVLSFIVWRLRAVTEQLLIREIKRQMTHESDSLLSVHKPYTDSVSMVGSAIIWLKPTEKHSLFLKMKHAEFLIYSASLFACFVMSGSFKGLGNEARPSAVLAACSHTATQAKPTQNPE